MEPDHKPVNRGWFFPIAIVTLLKKGTINEAEFVLLGLINELCNPSCTASNNYLAEKWGKSKRWVEETISKFRDLGVVQARYKKEANGLTKRWIKVTFAGDETTTEENFGGYRRKTVLSTEENFGQSNKKEVTTARCADDAPGVGDSSDTFGLDGKTFTMADELAQMFSDWTVKNGLHVGRSGSYMNGWTKRTMGNWARSCRQLLTQEESKEVRRVLVWYLRHWKDEYVPQCHSMRKFCERFVDIQRQMRKNNGDGEAPRKKVLAGVAIVNGKRIEYFDRE